MKRLLFLGAIMGAFFGMQTPLFALSCVSPMPTFHTMYADATIAFRGVVTDTNFVYDDSHEDYCDGMDADTSELGVHTFAFTVQEKLKGDVSSTLMLTHTVDGIHCTRGGSCTDLQLGEEYVVLTEDGETIASGLCGPCPYVLASEFSAPPKQPEESCVCTMQYDPVCGVDGKTYGNACALGCAGEERAYDGECVDTPQDQRVDSTCTRRYDGCNTCIVDNGKVGACTEIACLVMEREKCLDHDFFYLKRYHELIIKNTLERYLSGFSQQEQQVVREKLITRVEHKKSEILSVLMVSLFPQGSLELRRYQIQLEVLAAIDSML